MKLRLGGRLSRILFPILPVLLSGLVFATFSFSAEKQKNKPKPSEPRAEGAILDFEGDVIEGDRKSLDLFIQGDAKDQSLDVLLFDRKNFNSFHSIDRKYRPPLNSESSTTVAPKKGNTQ